MSEVNNIQSILDDINVVLEIGIDLADDEFVNELYELKQKLEQNKFYLVVAGLFKRGKSSVINAIINQEIAPVSVTPVTAIITIFEYNKTPKCNVIFKGGHIKEIPFEEIYHYVAEEENPENIKNVQQVKVYLNCDLLKKCCIVDTPGLGSVFEHNSEVTYNYIPKIDAALFVLSADIPISKTDAEFLKEINSSVPKVLYVLNKIDLLNENQLNKLINFNKKIIAEITLKNKEEISIIPISSKLYFEQKENNNIDKLRKSIIKLVEENKIEILQETGKNRLIQIASNIRELLKLKADTLKLPVKIIEEKQFSLKNSINLMNETRHEFDILIKGQLDKIIEKYIEKLNYSLENLKNEFIKNNMPFLIQNLKSLKNEEIDKLHNNLSNNVVIELEKIKKNIENEIISEFNSILNKYENRSQSFLNEFSKILKELFNTDFTILAKQFNLDLYTSFYFLKHVDSQTISPKISFFEKLLPKRLAIKKLQKIFIENTLTLIEVNKGRMISDITYKVNESFRKFKAEEEKQINNVFNRINKLLEEAILKKKKNENEIAKDLNKIHQKINILDKLIS